MESRLASYFAERLGTGFFVPGYASMLAVAVLLGLYLSVVRAEHEGLDATKVFRSCLLIVCGALVSARLYVVAQDWDYYRLHAAEAFRFWEGGVASYGAFAGGTLAALVAARWQRLAPGRLLDCCAPPVAVAVAVGRVGCFLHGCCHGGTTGAAWAVRFPSDTDAHRAQVEAGLIEQQQQLSLPVHPTQLYEAAFALLVFCLLVRFGRRRRRDGELFAWLFVLYPLGRFFFEFLRGDERGAWLGLSTPQLFSLVALALALTFILPKRFAAVARGHAPARASL